MLGRTPDSIVAKRPLKDGVIADYRTTEAMLRYFINKALGGVRFFRPEVMVAVPGGITSTERRAVVEKRDQDDPAGDVRQVHGLLLALMEQRVEIRFADEPGQLVIGAEIGRRQRGKSRRVEVGLLPHGRDQLPRAIHKERAPGVAVEEELLERMRDRPEIVFREGPTGGTNGHGGGLKSVKDGKWGP